MHPIETALLEFFNQESLSLFSQTHSNQTHSSQPHLDQSVVNSTDSEHLAKRTLFIAYSGGLDSSVLLHAAVQLIHFKKIKNLTALHVNHGLQKQASDWQIFCEKKSKNYKVSFLSVKLNLLAKNKTSEDDARKGRYDFFEKQMEMDDVIALAHHQNDQVETLLFRLFRGTGLHGLSGIPKSRKLKQGHLIRPLLEFTRQDLKQYAKQNKLEWIEDPSNLTNQYSRNFIRNDIIPLIKTQWPSVEKSLMNFSNIAKEQIEILNEVAQQDLKLAEVNYSVINGLQLQPLKLLELEKLSKARQKNCLHYWVKQLTGQSATSKEISEVLHQLYSTDRRFKHKSIKVKVSSGWMRSYDSLLFYCLSDEPSALTKSHVWKHLKEDFVLDNGLKLTCFAMDINQEKQPLLLRAPNKNEVVTLRARVGGEVITPSYRQHSAELKKVYQELKIPTWQRKWLPLIYYNEQLVAIPGVVVDRSVLYESSDLATDSFSIHFQRSNAPEFTDRFKIKE